MNKLLFLLLFFACVTPKDVPYDHFYYSQQAYERIKQMREGGVKPAPTIARVNGVIFTCQCPPTYIEKTYKKQFPDVVLIRKDLRSQAEVTIEY